MSDHYLERYVSAASIDIRLIQWRGEMVCR